LKTKGVFQEVSVYVSGHWGAYSDDCAGSGTLMPGVVARVIKRDGTLGGYDESGELVLLSPSRALGYLNNVDAWVIIVYPA